LNCASAAFKNMVSIWLLSHVFCCYDKLLIWLDLIVQLEINVTLPKQCVVWDCCCLTPNKVPWYHFEAHMLIEGHELVQDWQQGPQAAHSA